MATPDRELSTTTSLCPTCLERVPGTYEARDDAVYLSRDCPDHGVSRRKVWDSLDHWEWRFGQNWGPYRYLIDWNFHSDGTIDVTSRHPTTGFRTTNGYPKYTFHFTAEPAFDAATVHAHDGSSWSKVANEGKMQAGDVEQVRIQNADGPERLVIERPGDVCYALQYDPETIEYDQTLEGVAREMIQHKQYLDGDNYIQGNSIDGERVLMRMYASRDTGEGTHATTDPFAFRFTMRAENY